MLICLIAALAISVAAAPILQANSGQVWAKSSKKKTSKKKKKKKGFVKKNGKWYYYYRLGKRQLGWFEVKGRRFFAYKSGSKKAQLAIGWTTIRKKKYFFRDEGKKGVIGSLAINGVAKVNGIKCIFDAEGNLAGCKYAGPTDTFIEKVGEMARMNQAENNILASLVVAQACLETGYGKYIYRNNLFGIRSGYGYKSYDSWEESIEDYVDFMHEYIPSIFGVRNAYTACWIIGNAGYAEAGNYGSVLSSIVSSNNLTRFNK